MDRGSHETPLIGLPPMFIPVGQRNKSRNALALQIQGATLLAIMR
jgi:hypothetical protein